MQSGLSHESSNSDCLRQGCRQRLKKKGSFEWNRREFLRPFIICPHRLAVAHPCRDCRGWEQRVAVLVSSEGSRPTSLSAAGGDMDEADQEKERSWAALACLAGSLDAIHHVASWVVESYC